MESEIVGSRLISCVCKLLINESLVFLNAVVCVIIVSGLLQGMSINCLAHQG